MLIRDLFIRERHCRFSMIIPDAELPDISRHQDVPGRFLSRGGSLRGAESEVKSFKCLHVFCVKSDRQVEGEGQRGGSEFFDSKMSCSTTSGGKVNAFT